MCHSWIFQKRNESNHEDHRSSVFWLANWLRWEAKQFRPNEFRWNHCRSIQVLDAAAHAVNTKMLPQNPELECQKYGVPSNFSNLPVTCAAKDHYKKWFWYSIPSKCYTIDAALWSLNSNNDKKMKMGESYYKWNTFEFFFYFFDFIHKMLHLMLLLS